MTGQPRSGQLQGPAGYSQGPPCKGAIARKGRPPAGVADHKWATGYGCGAHRKAAYGQRHRPLPTRKGLPPKPALPPARATAPATGVAAPWQGGCQRARAAVACAGAAAMATTAKGGKRVRASF
ncbi:hypothetical protein BHM03_00040785 [Ensete ventricosum]|nr:hypothetical protein BHM03_00040785 [Ensete ventricosum]